MNNKSRGYLTLIGGSLIQFTVGSFFTTGNLIPFLASYFAYIEYHISNDHHSSLNIHELQRIYSAQVSKTNWIFFVLLISFSFATYLGGCLEIRFGPKKTLIIASFFMSFGFGLTYFALQYGGIYSLYWCGITLGIIWGFGVGLGYPVLIVVGMRWFPNNRGFVGGLCGGIIGGGGMIFNSLESYFANPYNIKFDPNIGFADKPNILICIPLMYIYIALIMILMQCISIFCISNPPWFVNAKKANSKRMAVQLQMQHELYSLTVAQAMEFSAFWVFFAQTFTYVIISVVIILQWKVFAMDYLLILNDDFLSLIGSISALGLGFGRIFWGVFFDFVGHSYRITQCLMSGVLTIFIVTWPLCSYSPLIMFPIWNFILWFHVNCCFAIYPSAIANAFGAKYVGSFLGCMTTAEIFSTLFVVIMAPHSQTWFHGWPYYLLMIGGFGVCNMIVASVFKPKINRKQYLLTLQMKEYKKPLSEKKRLIISANKILHDHSYQTFSPNVGSKLEL